MKDLKKEKSSPARSRPPGREGRPAVQQLRVDAEDAGQRIDNFLMRVLKGVPRTHIYRVLRSGEVRVNSGRVDATYRLEDGDLIRVPPIRRPTTVATRTGRAAHPAPRYDIVYEDEALLVINKPAGLAVHGGSGLSFGAIEQLRAARPEARYLELVHRLDRETSGLLMIAKKRSALTGLHASLRAGKIHKAYLAMVRGAWTGKARDVEVPLRRYLTPEGERRVAVDARHGVPSRTRFEPKGSFGGGEYSLLRAILDTGRTHQIRVSLVHLGFPILGDDKYGDFDLNRRLAGQGLKRMFLHAAELGFEHPLTGESVRLEAPLPPDLAAFVDSLAPATAS